MTKQGTTEKNEKITSFLREEGILDEAMVKKLTEESSQSGKSILSILKSRNLINPNQFTKLTATTNNIEFINLSPEVIDPVAVHLVSFEIARQHTLIPVRIEKNTIYVAMSSPLNLFVRDTITTKTGYKVVPLAATTEAVNQAIAYHFNVESVTKQDIVAMRLKQSSAEDTKTQKNRGQLKISDAPIVRLVDSIITGAIDARASDLHIEPQEPDMRVRYRIDGILVEAIEVPASVQREVISHIKILANMDISERRLPQDGHISIYHNNKDYDLRVSSLPGTNGEKIVIRILDTSVGLASLEDIISSPGDLAKFNTLIKKPYGMILLAGPTGSGKTTTLNSIIQSLNCIEKNIVTVEDPVEYRLVGVTQVQVKSEIGMTFASGLRSILRQDPDIILIGEIRDLETAEIAISAALTGHLVLSTLHTNDAAGAMSRLINLGVSPFQLSSAMLGIIAQRLVRTLCPKCKESYEATPEELEIIYGKDANKKQKTKNYRSKGCDACRNTGYLGRQGVYEILEIDSTIKDMVVEGVSDNEIKNQAIAQGMKTLKIQGIEQVSNGTTTMEEVQRVIDVREE